MCFASTKAYSQWTDHFSLSGCTYSGIADKFAYAGNSMGFTLFDTEEHTIQKCTKSNYLSDVGISTVKTIDNKLFVGYSNGNIDIVDIEKGSTVNIPELKNNNNYNIKAINSFSSNGNYVYASTKCGLFVIDKSKRELKNHYKINNSETINVLSSAVNGGYIYVSTEAGVYRANVNSSVLEDPDEWHLIIKGQSWSVVAFGNDVLSAQGSCGSGNTLIITANREKVDTLLVAPTMRNMSVFGNTILFAYNNSILIKDNNYNNIKQINSFSDETGKVSLNIQQACQATENTIVIADYTKGVVVADMSGNIVADALYNGPSSNTCYKIMATPKGIYATAGGINSAYNNLNIRATTYCYANGEWISSSSTAGRDILNIAYDPNRPDSVYVSSWGNGIFKIKDFKISTQYSAVNSALQDIFGGNSYVRVNAIAYDNNSNLIVSNAQVLPGLLIKTPTNEWFGLSYALTDPVHSTKDMIVTSNGNCWLTLPRSNYFVVFNTNDTPETDTDDMYRGNAVVSDDSRWAGELRLWDSDGEVISDIIYALAEDHDGNIWMGTNNGVVVFKDNDKVFETQHPISNRIKVPRNDGTNNADYLLSGVNVYAIAVDGANRKWIGTETDGVYLVSDDGLQTIHTFNKDNSPLPSNEINSITIDTVRGEVFFATANGIVSFAGTANEPVEKLSKVKVYPNPVVPTYRGYVKISGLENNTRVFITDINGRLVFEDVSYGGMAMWNTKDTDGHDVSTGTYMIWTANYDGTEKAVGKIAVIR